MKEAGTRKQAILLMSHFFNRTIEEKYNRLCRELDEERYNVFLLLNVNDKQTMQDIPTSVRLCLYDANDLNELGYTPIYEKLLPGSCHFPVLKFFLEHREYNFYWFIEYDVEFTAPWNVLMDDYLQNEADFIAPFVEKYEDKGAGKWNWWKLRNDSGFPLPESIRTFHPICRYSSAALLTIDEHQKKGYSAHSELLIPTCLYHAGLRLAQFDSWAKGVRYRPPYAANELKESKILYHPVKA